MNDSAVTTCRLISLTPVRNESWIIDRFLAATRTWATDVVIADQGSTDGTVEILRSDGDVHLVINDCERFDENHRQRILLERARHIPGKRVLVGLDADEAFSANCTDTEDWQRIQAAPPGTVLRFRWVNVLPGFKTAWIPGNLLDCGYVDDGCEHTGRTIHSPRVPRPAGAPVLEVKDFVVLHFQYVAWDRMRRKHRWYQVWEYLHHMKNRPLDIYRMYNHMGGSWTPSEVEPMRPEWLEGYDRAGIDFRSLKSEPLTWWDTEVVRLLCEHGPQTFRRLPIWDQDWNAVAASTGVATCDLSDPRSRAEKTVHRLLAATQGRRQDWSVRAFERCLRMSGW